MMETRLEDFPVPDEVPVTATSKKGVVVVLKKSGVQLTIPEAELGRMKKTLRRFKAEKREDGVYELSFPMAEWYLQWAEEKKNTMRRPLKTVMSEYHRVATLWERREDARGNRIRIHDRVLVRRERVDLDEIEWRDYQFAGTSLDGRAYVRNVDGYYRHWLFAVDWNQVFSRNYILKIREKNKKQLQRGRKSPVPSKPAPKPPLDHASDFGLDVPETEIDEKPARKRARRRRFARI